MDAGAPARHGRAAMKRSGVTLIEIIVALSIGVLAGGVIYQFSSHSARRYQQTIQQGEAQKDLLLCLKYLRSDLSHLREYQPADPRYGHREIANLFAVTNDSLSFATSRGEKITYRFQSNAYSIIRTVEVLPDEQLTIPELIWKKVQERADATFSMVTSEIRDQVDQQIAGFKSVFNLGDPHEMAQNPSALINKCEEVFEKIEYYTGKNGAEPQFVNDLKATIAGRAKEMATEIGYGVEADAEEIMGTLLTRFFEVESLTPPRILRAVASEREFQLSGSYQVILGEGGEKPPGELNEADSKNIMGFRVFLASANPISSLEQFYQEQGVIFIPTGLLLRIENQLSRWHSNPPPRVRLKIMDLITSRELESRFFGEAIIPDADILYRTWVEIPEFWFLDIFNTEEEVEKLRKGLINPDEAEPTR
jgi:type II secretory pathway pseudopilin PulG